MKKTKWTDLTSEERKELMDVADTCGIPPNFVAGMYDQGMIALPSDCD